MSDELLVEIVEDGRVTWAGTAGTLLLDNDGDEDVRDAVESLRAGKPSVLVGGGAAPMVELRAVTGGAR